MKLFSILTKNFKLLLRSKSSAFTVFIGPMIIIALILFTFSSSEELSFSVGIIDTGEFENAASDFTNSLTAEGYTLIEYDIVYDCIEDMKSAKINLCLHFLEANESLDWGIEAEVGDENSDPTESEAVLSDKKQVAFYVDQSRTNIVESIMLSVGQNIEGKSEEMTEEKIKEIIENIGNEIGSIQSIEGTLSSYITDSVEGAVSDIETESASSNSAAVDLQNGMSAASSENSIAQNNADLVDAAYTELLEQLESLMDEADAYAADGTDLKTELDAMEALLEDDLTTDNLLTLQTSLSTLNSKLNDAVANSDVVADGSSSIAENIEEISSKISEIKTGLANIKTSANAISVLAGQDVENEYEIQFNEIVSSSDKSLFMFPYYLVLLIVFVGMMLSSTLVNIEKQSLAFFRNHTSPTSGLTHLVARFGTNFSILLMQVAAVLVAGYYYLEIPIFNNFAVTSTIILMTITFFIFLGYFLGLLFKTQEGITIAFISVGSLCAFLSNLILPIETFSFAIREVLMYNPYMLTSELLKKALIFESGFIQLGTGLWTLALYVVVIVLAVLIIQKISLSLVTLSFTKNSMLRMPHITRDNKFKLEDGTIIDDLEGLVDALKKMSNEKFLLYGIGKNNEFALWIKDAFKMKKVARKIMKVTNKSDTIKLLNEYLKNKVKK